MAGMSWERLSSEVGWKITTNDETPQGESRVNWLHLIDGCNLNAKKRKPMIPIHELNGLRSYVPPVLSWAGSKFLRN